MNDAKKQEANRPVPTSRKQLTPEQRAVQDSLKKVKRLNVKLAKIKQVALQMEKFSQQHQTVPAKYIKRWSEQVLSILNVNNDQKVEKNDME